MHFSNVDKLCRQTALKENLSEVKLVLRFHNATGDLLSECTFSIFAL